MKRHHIFFVILVLSLLSACQNSTKTPTPDPTPDANLTLSLSPAGPILTNSPLNFSVTVTGGSADTLELQANDDVLGRFGSTNTFLWNANEADGSYIFKAVASAGSKTFSSNEVLVTLDRTAPSIVSRSPEAGASGVAADAVVEIVFSEVLVASSLTTTSLSVTAKSAASISASPSLSADGKTLSVSLSGVTAPETLTLSLEGLSDAAGNTLSDSWSWSVPAAPVSLESFKQLGDLTELLGSARELGEKPLAMVADASGNLVMAFISDAKIQVLSWSGSSWTGLAGLPVDAAPDSLPTVALLSDGRPVVAWRNGTDNPATTTIIEPSGIHVQRWNGTGWDDLGQVNTALEASAPSLAISADDKIYVAYHESDGINPNVLVAQYEGSSWQPVADILDTTAAAIAINPALSVDSNGVPSVAWWEAEADGSSSAYVKQLNGSSWQALGTALNVGTKVRANMLSLASGPDNLPVVAWHETNSAAADPLDVDHIYAKKWDGSSWQALGGAIDRADADGAQYPALAIDSANTINLVWFEGLKTSSFENNSIILAQWREDNWLEIGQLDTEGPPIEQAYYPSIAISGATQTITVAWIQDNLVDSVRLKALQSD